jgi:Lon protease-like protein
MSINASPLHNFTGMARLFPLPNLVFFPQVVQGLQIFEPRYRQLVADALASDQLIALVLLQPEVEAPPGQPPLIESVACLGQIVWYDSLPDGRFNLRLRGLHRIRILEEVPSNRLYRMARVEVIPEVAPTELKQLKQLRQQLAAALLPRYETDGPAQRQLQELFESDTPLGQVCDVLSYALPLAIEVKQALLAESHVERRVAALIEALQIASARASRRFPPDFSLN